MGYQCKKEGKNPELIQSSTTPDPGYQLESNKLIIRHHKRESRGQPFPAGDHKANLIAIGIINTILSLKCMIMFFHQVLLLRL